MTLDSTAGHREATVDLMRRVMAKTPNPKIATRLAYLIDDTGADPTQDGTYRAKSRARRCTGTRHTLQHRARLWRCHSTRRRRSAARHGRSNRRAHRIAASRSACGPAGVQHHDQDRLAEFALDLANHTDVLLIACGELSLISAAITVRYVDSLDVLTADIIRLAA